MENTRYRGYQGRWRLFACVFVLTILAVTSEARAVAAQPKNPTVESDVVRAVFADGNLWVLTSAGQIFTIGEDENLLVANDPPEPALDMCFRDKRPVVIGCADKSCASWRLRQWSGSKWLDENDVQKQHDDLLGITCDAEHVVVLTSRRFVDSTNPRQKSILLSKQLVSKWFRYITMLATPNWVFVSNNKGEWGGGLWRIDRRTGTVAEIARNTTGELCGGPLNTDCDPVNGIAVEPWNPGCIAVAIGLVHFVPHGRIVQVCGEQVTRLFYKPFKVEGFADFGKKSDEPSVTVAFFGLISDGAVLCASAIDGIYRIDANGVATSSSLSKFKQIGSFEVNFGYSDFVLVQTGMSVRYSASSGLAPMIVPR